MSDRICLMCREWYFHAGSPEYSSWTPAEEAESGCRQGVWCADFLVDAEDDWRGYMKKAETCEMFVPVDIEGAP